MSALNKATRRLLPRIPTLLPTQDATKPTIITITAITTITTMSPTATPKEGETAPRRTETARDIASTVIQRLRARRQTLGVAESLTSGLVMAAVGGVPGASGVFRGGAVTYATGLKGTLLGVDGALVEREGAVHADVAAQMAEGARRVTVVTAAGGGGGSGSCGRSSSSSSGGGQGEGQGQEGSASGLTDWGVGTTGVAGPDAQDGKPAGTVYIGIASPSGSRAFGPFVFPGSRDEVREAAALEALASLREVILESDAAADAGKGG